jgi:hypothetical protein
MRLKASAFGVVFCWAVVVGAPIEAQQTPSNLCDQKPPEASYFPEMRQAAIAVRTRLCLENGSQSQVFDALLGFVAEQESANAFEPYGGFQPKAGPLEAVQRFVREKPEDLDNAQVPTIAAGATPTELMVGGTERFAPSDLQTCDKRAAEKKAGSTCAAVLAEYSEFFRYAKATFTTARVMSFASATAALSEEWNRYLFESRSQTPLELFINSALYRKGESLNFAAAPKRQWIILHPSLVVENVDDAIDGEKAKEAVILELVGVDYWRQDRWYAPTGGSVVRVYSDRPGVPSTGYGVALHFRHTYSIGFTDHDGDSGVFVSFDFLKLLQDKKKALEEFQK